MKLRMSFAIIAHAFVFIVALTGTAATSVGDPAPAAMSWNMLPVGNRSHIRDVAISRVDSKNVLLWTGILYRSTDSGDHFEMIPVRFERGSTPPDLRNLTFDPVDASTAWATIGDCIIRSTNLGTTWESWGDPVPGPTVSAIAFQPGVEGISWIGIGGGSARGAYRTPDAGDTWERLGGSSLIVDVTSIVFDPSNLQTVLVGSGHGIYRSTDHGTEWARVTTKAAAHQLRWSASGSVARALQSGLIESTDHGLTWNTRPLPSSDVRTMSFDPLSPDQMMLSGLKYGLVGGGFYCAGYGYAGTLYGSTNGGEQWTNRSPGPGTTSFPTYSPGLEMFDDKAWAWYPTGTSDSGDFARTENGGATWVGLNDEFHEGGALALGSDATGRTYIFGDSGFGLGILVSTNAGVTWNAVPSPERGFPHTSQSAQVHAGSGGDLVWVGVFGSCDAPLVSALRLADGGATVLNDPWENSFENFGEAPTTIAFDAGSRQSIHVWNSNRPAHGSIHYFSVDGGLAFTDFPASEFPAEAVITPETDSFLWARFEESPYIRYSTNGGFGWISRSAGLPTNQGKVVRLLVDSQDGSHALAVLEKGAPFETRDSGHSWVRFGQTEDRRGIPERSERADSAILDLRDVKIRNAAWDTSTLQTRVFLETDRGVWISDVGFVNGGLPNISLDQFIYNKTFGFLLASSSTYGVFKLDVSAPVRGLATALASHSTSRPLNLQFAPNPFTGDSRIFFDTSSSGPVTLRVYDVGGRRVKTILEGELASGTHALHWDGRGEAGRNLATGIYFLRLDSATDQGSQTVRVVHTR